jgi:Replication-relaxation
MQLGFLKHALMISRMHFMPEMACRNSAGAVELDTWAQGAQLAGHKVEVPSVKSERQGGNQYLWSEKDDTERLPVEPDAMFTLRFTKRPAARQLAHFFYEADRGTMTGADMMRKLRAYYYFSWIFT